MSKYCKNNVSLYRTTALSNRGTKQRNCVRTERENKHEVVRVTGAKQLPCAVVRYEESCCQSKRTKKKLFEINNFIDGRHCIQFAISLFSKHN